MNPLYADALKMIRTAIPPHKGLELRLSEAYFGGVIITVFLDNFAEFSEPQRQDFSVWLGQLCQKVRDTGIPCFIEGAETRTRKGKYAL